MSEVISKLMDKNDKAACDYAWELGSESAESDKYLSFIPEFAGLLSHQNSYVRTRGFMMICNQARWAEDGQIEAVFDQMAVLLHDKKPTVVRQCLKALHEVAIYRPELSERMLQAIGEIDCSLYKDSMSPLIEKDIKALKSLLE